MRLKTQVLVDEFGCVCYGINMAINLRTNKTMICTEEDRIVKLKIKLKFSATIWYRMDRKPRDTPPQIKLNR